MYKINIGLLLTVALLFVQCKTQKSVEVNNQAQNNEQVSFRANPPVPTEAKPVNIGDYNQFQLENGLTVIVVQNHKLPVVSYQLFVDAAPEIEGDKVGVSYIMGSLLSEGTKKRDKVQLDKDIDFIGARFVTFENGMFGSTLTKHSDKLLEVFKEVLSEPAFSEESFNKLINQNISGLSAEKSDPSSLVSRIGRVVNYGKETAYGEVFTEEAFRNITLEDTKKLFESSFKPEISYLTIVGDIELETAKEQAQKYFGFWEKTNKTKTPAVIPTGKIPTENRVVIVDKPGAAQSLVYATYPVDFTIDGEDYVAARLMNTLFGGYFSSRLNMRLREEKAYTYGARSSLSYDKYIGSLSAGASVGTEVTYDALVQILDVMMSMTTDYVSDDELQVAKNVMIGNFAISLEQPQTLANFASNISRYNLPSDFYNNYAANIDKVTKEDILRMAKKYLKPTETYLLVVGDKDVILNDLQQLDADGKVEVYDVDGNLIEQSDEEVVFEPLKVINNYIEKVGGYQNIKDIKSYRSVSYASVMGQKIGFEAICQYPDKYNYTVKMSGMVLQEQMINGDKGVNKAQGQTMEMTPEEVKQMKESIHLVPQLRYSSPEYKVTSMGAEKSGDDLLYKVKVEKPGSTSIDFYSANTGLLVKNIMTSEQMGEKVTLTSNYSDYKSYGNIKQASKTTIEGGPMPMIVEMETLELNYDTSNTKFME